ncbi:uncharacterized protein B0H18DRAFT_1083195 [Fomitopsis serialis]|uniref:uncharacterized protein n=1 Tax=Fomitopsis serialis TaxID=139415 RepID=UPI00200787D2|nr:uncharacterized protein B0H18DRAFT_1083195 [Neoantrodia serialis]KAH9933010.1 hypothetical protein B0H18DRAFT_1083195 [Neoantrodia serialis]
MPHKRAKRTLREKQRTQSGRRASRKRRKSEGKDGGEGKSKLRIQPGESMAHFNRRVEDSMRGDVRVAMKNSSALARKVRKGEEATSKATKTTKKGAPAPRKQKPEEFERLSTSTPRRLNDIVHAPPELKKLPRGAKQRPKSSDAAANGEGAASLRQGALSMAQKAMLDEERLKAINMYREMKKAKAGG